MVEKLKNGTSISQPELSEIETTTNPLISITQVNPTTCKSTAPTQDGGRCSSMTMDTLLISEAIKLFPSRIERMLKHNQFGQAEDLEEDIHPKFGRLSILITWEMKLMIRRVK